MLDEAVGTAVAVAALSEAVAVEGCDTEALADPLAPVGVEDADVDQEPDVVALGTLEGEADAVALAVGTQGAYAVIAIELSPTYRLPSALITGWGYALEPLATAN